MVFDACEVRFHDAFINSTKDLIASLLNPTNLLGDAATTPASTFP